MALKEPSLHWGSSASFDLAVDGELLRDQEPAAPSEHSEHRRCSLLLSLQHTRICLFVFTFADPKSGFQLHAQLSWLGSGAETQFSRVKPPAQ